MTRTPWIPGRKKPVREGMYEQITHAGIIVWSRWDGKCWHRGSVYVSTAERECYAADYQDLAWRGLTTKDGK